MYHIIIITTTTVYYVLKCLAAGQYTANFSSFTTIHRPCTYNNETYLDL